MSLSSICNYWRQNTKALLGNYTLLIGPNHNTMCMKITVSHAFKLDGQDVLVEAGQELELGYCSPGSKVVPKTVLRLEMQVYRMCLELGTGPLKDKIS